MVSGLEITRCLRAAEIACRVTPAEVETLCAAAEEKRQQLAHERALRRGNGNRTARCEICGCFKPRPSADCPGPNCGDQPMPHNATELERIQYDKARGWNEPGWGSL
jgi:hypothetical protein